MVAAVPWFFTVLVKTPLAIGESGDDDVGESRRTCIVDRYTHSCVVAVFPAASRATALYEPLVAVAVFQEIWQS
jgi:hypothetical protein